MEILANALVRAGLHGAVAVAVVWLVCRLFPRLPAALRCGLWWLACLKLLVALVWVEPISLAVLPASETALPPGVQTPGYHEEKIGPQGGLPPSRPLRDGLLQGSQGFEPLAAEPLASWPLALVALWGAGLLVQLGVTARQLAVARRIVRGAEPVREPWITALFTGLQEQLGVRRATLLASPEVETPQVSGTWRPRVLLPRREIGRLSAQELALTLAHELLHVRRGDLWLGWVPALAQRLFFFHPLAALAAREYALAREAACDAAVLRTLDPAPETYGRLLLRLGVTSRVPRLAAAGAAPTFQILKRRLEMLQQSADKKRIHRGWWGLLALLALAVLIPIQIVAQPAPPEPPAAPAAPEAPEAPDAVEPGEPAPPAEPAPAAEPGEPAPPAKPGEPVPSALPAPPAPPSPPTLPVAAPIAPVGAPVAVPSVPPAPGAPPVPGARPVARVAHMGAPPAPPAPPAAPTPPVPPAKGSWMNLDEDGEPWVVVEDEDSVTMSGSGRDVREARKHYSGKPLLWFERDGKSYVVRDAATVARAQKIFAPQRELGKRQGELGAQQGKLGAQQGRLGAEMGSYGARMGGAAAQQAGRAVSGKEDDESLEAEMEELSEKMEELGRQMEELGRQQEELGRQQEKLGEQQEKLAREGERQLKSLLDQAISSGLAQEVRD